MVSVKHFQTTRGVYEFNTETGITSLPPKYTPKVVLGSIDPNSRVYKELEASIPSLYLGPKIKELLRDGLAGDFFTPDLVVGNLYLGFVCEPIDITKITQTGVSVRNDNIWNRGYELNFPIDAIFYHPTDAERRIAIERD